LIGLLVFACGAAGAACRYLVDGAVQERFDGAFPLGTFVVNMSGSLALGVVVGFFLHHTSAPIEVRVAVGTGFIGAYTTFSTWMLETLSLLRERARLYALANLLGSLAAGMLAAFLGLWLGGLP